MRVRVSEPRAAVYGARNCWPISSPLGIAQAEFLETADRSHVTVAVGCFDSKVRPPYPGPAVFVGCAWVSRSRTDSVLLHQVLGCGPVVEQLGHCASALIGSSPSPSPSPSPSHASRPLPGVVKGLLASLSRRGPHYEPRGPHSPPPSSTNRHRCLYPIHLAVSWWRGHGAEDYIFPSTARQMRQPLPIEGATGRPSSLIHLLVTDDGMKGNGAAAGSTAGPRSFSGAADTRLSLRDAELMLRANDAEMVIWLS